MREDQLLAQVGLLQAQLAKKKKKRSPAKMLKKTFSQVGAGRLHGRDWRGWYCKCGLAGWLAARLCMRSWCRCRLCAIHSPPILVRLPPSAVQAAEGLKQGFSSARRDASAIGSPVGATIGEAPHYSPSPRPSSAGGSGAGGEVRRSWGSLKAKLGGLSGRGSSRDEVAVAVSPHK